MSRRAKEDVQQWCKDEWGRVHRYWREVWQAIYEERAFYEGQHFEEQTDPHQRDRRMMYVITQDNFDRVRHKAAKLTDSPHQVEARPLDNTSDPDDAEVAANLIQWELDNPQKCFADYCDLMTVSAISARIGGIFFDFDPDMGPWGELLFRPIDWAHAGWEPGFHDPHDLACGYFFEERYLPISWLESNKRLDQKVVAQLNPEEYPIDRGRLTQETGKDERNDGVLTRWWWKKNDPSVKEVAPETGFKPFDDPGDRYLTCAADNGPGCGWSSDPQSALGVDGEMPEHIARGCPICGGDLWRVDGTRQATQVLAYPKGRRLIIETPNQPSLEPLYDDAWPLKTLRSFPLYVLTDYLPSDPRKPVGPSDVSLNWTQQIAKDLILTKTLLALDAHQRYFAMPANGVTDYLGKRFEFRDDQFNVMYYDEQRWSNPPAIMALEGSSMDAAVPAFYNMLNSSLQTNQGTGDFGLSDANSKDIPATTVMQLSQMGELPIEHLKRRYQRALAKGHGALWDAIRETYTAARLARLKIAGIDTLRNVRGDELPNYDFAISDSPNFNGLEKQKIEALDALTGRPPGMPIPPEFMPLYAQAMNLSPSIVRQVERLRQQAAEMAPPMMPGVPPAAPDQAGMGGGGAAIAAGAPPMGTNGNVQSPMAAGLMAGMRQGGMVPGMQ